MTRLYSSISVETTLASTISNSATSMTVATGTGSALLGGVTLAAGNVDQFTVAIDPDTANEEIVFITGSATDTFTIVRARAGTSGVSHSAGATVKHVLTSDDLNAFKASISPVSNVGFAGSTSGITTLQANAVAGTTTLTLPAVTDTLVGKTTVDTLTNKTLTAPKFADGGFIADANSNELIILDSNTSAVNEITVANAATGNKPTISATGGDTNITLNLISKGTGTVQVNTVDVVTISNTQTLTNKTLTSPVINDAKQNITLNPQTGTTYTLALTDNGKLVTLNNSDPITVTVGTNSSYPFTTGAIVNIQQIGTGLVTIQGASGVTITSTGVVSNTPEIRTQYSAASIIKVDTDSWTVIGDIS